MICDECLEYTSNYHTIGNNCYCHNCKNKYMLVKCPGHYCNKIVSINGYDELDNIELNTCSSCDTVFCDNCLIKETNVIMCKDCFNF